MEPLAGMRSRPPIWYFDKVCGAIVLATGIGLIMLGLLMGYVWNSTGAPLVFLGLLLIVALAAITCLYTGVMLLKRSGQD